MSRGLVPEPGDPRPAHSGGVGRGHPAIGVGRCLSGRETTRGLRELDLEIRGDPRRLPALELQGPPYEVPEERRLWSDQDLRVAVEGLLEERRARARAADDEEHLHRAIGQVVSNERFKGADSLAAALRSNA